MTHDTSEIHPAVRRLAVAVAVIALLPIGMGSLVTTLGAGMAFLDWPSSDGRNMLLYPWLSDFRTSPDKFVEHGHRLAGMLIGLMAIALVCTTWKFERRGWVRRMSLVILIAVIAQGLLGGMRVILDQQVLAMTHSITGAAFFCLCCMFALACRPRWKSILQETGGGISPLLQAATCMLPLVVMIQYTLGGAFRHLNTMLNEHIIGAVVTSLLTVFVVTGLFRSGSTVLSRHGRLLTAALLFQVFLGLTAYVTRLGLPMVGYVATVGSLSESIFCSAHTIGGMFLLNAAVLTGFSTVRLLRHDSVRLIHVDEQLSLPSPGREPAS